jgi:hypothetical protein
MLGDFFQTYLFGNVIRLIVGWNHGHVVLPLLTK